jgi:hypothetical protein
MFDFLAFLICFFLISFLILIILVGVKFFHSLATIGQPNKRYNEETDKQLIENSIEDSQGDGLVLFDDPLFPEESDEDDDY